MRDLNVAEIFGNVISFHTHPEIFKQIQDAVVSQEDFENNIVGRIYGVPIIIDPTIYPYYFEKEIGPSGR